MHIPNFVKNLTVILSPGSGGTATLEYTTEDNDTVDADPSAVAWVLWEPGSVSVATARETGGSITALRISAATAAATVYASGTKG